MSAVPTPRPPISGRFGALEVVPLSGSMGAEIRGLDLRTLDDSGFKVLYEAYLDHLLVLVREQTLSDEDQVAVARRFGTLEMPPAANERSSHQHYDGPPEITVVSNIKVNGVPIGELGDGEVIWHSDYSFREVIAGMRILRAVKLPPAAAGGNTEFCARLRTDSVSAIAMSVPWEGYAGEAQFFHLGLLILESSSWRYKKS